MLKCRMMHLDGWQSIDYGITWEDLMEDERILEIGYFLGYSIAPQKVSEKKATSSFKLTVHCR